MTTTNNPSQGYVDPNFIANDDASVARRMAKIYEAQGMDPSMAFDSPDDAMLDFGINGLKDQI